MGRCGAKALSLIHLHERGFREELSGELRAALAWLREYFSTAPPRQVLCRASAWPVVIFTDGACEASSVSVGACIFEQGTCAEALGGDVPEELMSKWRADRSWQVIAQAELAPVLLATFTWRLRLKGRHVIFWVDQEAAIQGMIKGYSGTPMSAEIIDAAHELLAKFEIYPWFSRVPSQDNPADLPSRDKWTELYELFPEVKRVDIPEGAWALLE